MSVPGATATGKRSYLPAGERRSQILEVAKRVFARRGYQRASIQHICVAAKIGRGTLYQYFGNKQAVLAAILDQVAARMKKVLETRVAIDDLDVAPARIDARIAFGFCAQRLRDVLAAIFVDEQTLRIVLRDARGLDSSIDRTVSKIDHLVLGAIEADLDAAQRLGMLRPGDPRMLARYCLGGIEKVILMALANDEPIDLERLVNDTVQVQLFGLLSEEVPR